MLYHEVQSIGYACKTAALATNATARAIVCLIAVQIGRVERPHLEKHSKISWRNPRPRDTSRVCLINFIMDSAPPARI